MTNEIDIQRPILSVDEIDRSRFKSEATTNITVVKMYVYSILKNIFPPIQWVKTYKKTYLVGDIVSGLTVSMIRLPQGLAYGLLAGLAPINGVYLEFCQCLIYSILSTVPQNSMGTFSIVSLMVGTIIDKNFNMLESANITDADSLYIEKVDLATAMTLSVGIYHLLFGLLNLGILVILLPKPVVGGFTTASAIIVTLAQATHLFGFPVKRYTGFIGPIYTFVDIVKSAYGGLITWSSVIISVISIPILYISKLMQIKYKKQLKGFPIPTELLMVIFATVICYFMPEYNIKVVGEVPGGLPAPKVPKWSNMEKIATESFAIAVVAYATTLSLGKIFSAKRGFTFSANQEGFALGFAHVISSFFSCFPGSAALARSSLQESAGANTHLASIISASFMLVVILWIGPIFQTLPRAVLSCIVIVNLRSMFLQFKLLPTLWRQSRGDFVIWLSAFLGVMVFGVVGGLIIGVMCLVANLIRLNMMTKLVPIHSHKKSEYYYNTGDHDNIYEFQGPLNFISAENMVVAVKGEPLLNSVTIIDLKKVTSIDMVGGSALVKLIKGRELYLVDASPTVKQFLDDSNVTVSHFATVIDAVTARSRSIPNQEPIGLSETIA